MKIMIGFSNIETTAVYYDQLWSSLDTHVMIIRILNSSPFLYPPLADYLHVYACAQLVSQRVNLERLSVMVGYIHHT